MSDDGRPITQHDTTHKIHFHHPVARDKNSQDLLEMAKRVAQSEATVLISGESGTGKEILARFIHDCSDRREAAFIAINCAAIPENMLEATLFGYEKGSFTGAYQSCPGKFEQAQNGTLLLDEISEMDLNLQAKLLRVLQEKEVERIGGKKPIDLNVRVLATSNKDLSKAVSESKFREDLFYRINVFPLHWKPLRERQDDIIPLAEYLIKGHCVKEKKAVPALTEEAQGLLLKHHWPGNARELDNVIQRALILHKGNKINAADLYINPNDISTIPPTQKIFYREVELGDDLKKHEFDFILKAFDKHRGNRKLIAEQLGISERTLRYKLSQMRENGISI